MTPTPAPSEIEILFSFEPRTTRNESEADVGAFLWFGNVRVKVADDMWSFKELPGRIQGMVNEAIATYGDDS